VNSPPKAGCTSPYKGVGWDKGRARWRAYAKVDGHQHHLGMFDDEVEAARAYDEHAAQWGEFAWLNRDHFDMGGDA